MKAGIRRSISVLVLSPALVAQGADGLSVPDSVWPSWQARLEMHAAQSAVGTEAAGRALSASLLGDYYFSVPRLLPLSREGGLRATSGITSSTGLRMPSGYGPAYSEGADTLPYVGLGYTYAALKGGWGFTADVGLVAQSPGGALSVGRSLLGSGPALDDAVRSLRLAPVLQLGVRYTF